MPSSHNFQLGQPDLAEKSIMPTLPPGIEGRFWGKVDRSGGPDACWPWLGPRQNGYGKITIGSAPRFFRYAHVLAWTLTYGPLPAGKPCVLHRCDNPPCVNPAHLFPGTKSDNNADMVAKGRHAKGDGHWSRLYPDRVPRGDCNGQRTHPERTARGERVNTAKLTAPQVLEIAAASGSHAALGRKYGVSEGCISSIRKGKTWRHLRIREDAAPAVAFPAWTLSLDAIRYPDAREKHAGNYVPVQTVCRTTYDADGFAQDEWSDQ